MSDTDPAPITELTPLTREEIKNLPKDVKKLDGITLARAVRDTAIDEVGKLNWDEILGDKLIGKREDLISELTRRVLEEAPQRKAWAESNLITRDAVTGNPYVQPEAIKALNFDDFDKGIVNIYSSGTALNTRTETIIGDNLDKEMKLLEDNDALDLPVGRHMSKLGITPRWIRDVRNGRVWIPDHVTIKDFAGAPGKTRGTVVVGSGAGSYLTYLQELAMYIDYIVDEMPFYAAARHIPVPTGSIRVPRRYRNTSGNVMGTTDVKSEGSSPSTEGTIQADRLTFSLLTIAGYITASDEVTEENQIGLRQMLARDLRQDVAEKVMYFAMQGSGSTEPVGLFNTVIDSSGTTDPHKVTANHNSQWDDVKSGAKKLGGEYFAWLKKAAVIGAKSAYFDFNTRKDAFNNYIMRGANTVDVYPFIPASDATAQKAALCPPEDYWFAENLALTTMAMGIKEGKTLWTEGEVLFYMGVRYDSKHKHYKITSSEPNDCSMVLIEGLNA